MKATLIALVSMSAIAAMLVISGCDRANAAAGGTMRGRKCTIQFRRDALGAAAALPVGPMTDGINGAQTSISAIFKNFIEDWIVLDYGGKEVWVQKPVVLLIRFE